MYDIIVHCLLLSNMRIKKDLAAMKGMCARFVMALDATGLSDSAVSELLGYSGRSTLSSVRRGRTFPDAERLATFGRLLIRGVTWPNLHWILTGKGPRFLTASTKDLPAAKAVAVTVSLGPTVMPKVGDRHSIAATRDRGRRPLRK